MSHGPEAGDRPEAPSTLDAMKEFLGEAVGLERGFLRTILELRTRPAHVVDSYLADEHVYVSPFRLLIGVATVWVVVMNWFLDWNSIGQDYFIGVFGLLGDRTPDEHQVEFFGRVTDAMLSKYFIALLLAIVPIHAFMVTRFARRSGLPFRRHLAVIAYQFGTRTLIGFVLLIGFAIHALGTFALLIGLSLAGLLGWKPATRLTTGVPIERFYSEHGELVDRAYRKAGLILMSASFVGGISTGIAAGFLMASGRL